MQTKDINIRDPYVLVHGGKYYLYGTRSATCWGPADGFDCYISDDLEHWQGPIEIFHRPEDFFATENFWAPECWFYRDAFYLVTTFGGPEMKKGIYVLKSDKPEGPFELYGKRLTPQDWTCIDGTLYFEEGTPYLVFSHSFEDVADGDMCLLPLAEDLSRAVGAPEKLFCAAKTPWAHPVPFAAAEFGAKGDLYFTDGPGLMRFASGRLYMTWSSWGTCGYAVGTAVSEGGVHGPWIQLETPIFPENGGHGMMFDDLNGQRLFTLHYPNDKFAERPQFMKVEEIDGALVLKAR